MANEKAKVSLGSSGGSSGGGSSGGSGPADGLQLGASFQNGVNKGLTVKEDAGSGSTAKANVSGLSLGETSRGNLTRSGREKKEQEDKQRGLPDSGTKNTGLMLGQWDDSREGAALTNRRLTGNTGSQVSFDGELSKGGAAGKASSKASEKGVPTDFRSAVEQQRRRDEQAQIATDLKNARSLRDNLGMQLQKIMWQQGGSQPEGSSFSRRMSEINSQIRQTDESIRKLENRLAKATEPTEWAGRADLIRELDEIDSNSGYVTDPMIANQQAARRAEILQELERGDRQAGNGVQNYGEVDRSRNIFSGATKDYASGMVNNAGTGLQLMYEGVNTNPYAGWATDEMTAMQITPERNEEIMRDFEFLQTGAKTLQDTADQLGDGAAHDLERAKAGLGALGQAGVDIATNVIQMGYDAGIGALLGGGHAGLIPMYLRSAGAGEREARLNGASVNEQFWFGQIKGGIEAGTELIGNGVGNVLSKVYGAGVADDIAEEVIRHLAGSDMGRSFLRLVGGAAGEGAEEVLSDLLAPLAEKIYNREDSLGELYRNLSPAEIIYDFLIGAAIGGMGGATGILTGENAAANAELRARDYSEQLQLGAQEQAAAYQDEQDAQLQASQAAERAAQLQRRAEEAQQQAAAYQEEQSALLQAAQEREAAAAEAERAAAAARAAGDYQAEQSALLEATQERERAEQLQQQAEEAQRQAAAYQEEQTVILEAAQARQQEAAARQQAAAEQESADTPVDRESTAPNSNNDRTTPNRTGGNDNVQEVEQVTAEAQPGLLGQTEAQPGPGEEGLRVGAADEIRADPAAGTEASVGIGREDVSDGSGQRDAGGRAGGEAGRLDGDAGDRGSVAGTGRSGRASTGESIRDALRRSGQRQISSRAFGLERGTDTETFYEVPEEYLSADLRQLRYGIGNRTGYSVEFISGPMQVMGTDGRTHNVNGFCDPASRRIVVRLDSGHYTAEQIARHEEFHAMADQDPQLVNEIRNRITKRFGRQEMERIVRGYQIARRGVNRITGGVDAEIRETQDLIEEIFADANGNMNAFGLGANRFAYDTWTTVTDRQRSQTANGTRKTRGPPQQRYTYAGEQAETADMEQLDRAKEMERQDVDNETIRQQTGWFRGMDGKWRYEIDDSEAKFSRAGDLQFRKDHPEYDEYRNLMGRFGELTDEELNRFRSLDRMWSGEVNRLSRLMTESENPLTHVLQHDELFAAYPELKKVRVRLRDLGEGTNGTYDQVNRVITINKDSNDKVSTLLHEIQHAIQNIEGFTPGASPEYWAARSRMEDPELEARMDEIRESVRGIRAELDRQQKNAGYDEFMEELYQKAESGEINWNEVEARIQNFEREHAGIRSLNNALDQMYKEMQELRKRIRTEGDLYYNTAGEIEARDVQNRQGLSREGRNRKAPNLGDEKTVFAEGSGASYSTEVMPGPKVKENNEKNNLAQVLVRNIQQLKMMQPVTELSGEEMNDRSKTPREQIMEFFDSIGNRVTRETFGDVVLGTYGADAMINHHPLNRAKMVTIQAVPDVIRFGNLIGYDSNWKNRGYQTFIFGAPVKVAGKTVYVAAVVDQRANKEFYLNECVDSEGNYVRIVEGPTDNAKSGVTVQDGLTTGPVEPSETNVPQSAEESKKKFSVDEDQVTFDDITGGEMERSNWDPVFREKYERAQQVEEDVQEYFRKMDENDPDWLSEEDIEVMLDYDPFSFGPESASMEDAGYIADTLVRRAMNQTGEERQESYQLIERLLPYMRAIDQMMFTGDGNSDKVTSIAFKKWYDRRHPSLYYPGYEQGDLFDKGQADRWTAWDNQDKETEYLRELLDSGKLMEPELSQARNMLDRLENPEERDIFYSMDEDQIREEYEQLDQERDELNEFFAGLDFIDGKYIRTDSGRTVAEQDVQDRAARLEEVENRQRELREVLPEEETEEELPFDIEEEDRSGELSLGETERETGPAERTAAGEEQGLRLGAQEESEEENQEEPEGQMELPEDPKDRTIRELEAANRDLQKYAENWRKQASITGEGEETAKRSDVRRFTNELADEAEYQGEKAELQQKVQRLSDMVVSNDRGDGLDWNEIRRQAREIAEDLVDNSYTVVDPEADTRKAILADLKQMKIRPDREWTADFGDWNSMRQRLVGKIIFNAKEGQNIDDVYQQLRASYGEGLFPESITAGSDQLNRIIDALDQLRPSMNYNFASDQDAELATQYYQNKITDEVLFGNIGPELTKADRNYRRVKERMRDAEQKLREVKKESRQKIEDLQKMQRHEVRAAVENQRKQVREREEKQKLRKKISQTGKRLIKYLTENNGQKNPIPEPLKEAVGKVLLDLDISGGMDVKQKKKYVQDMQQVARIVTQQNAYMEGNTDKWAGMYLDLPADIQQELDEHLQNVQAAMDAAEAKGKVWNPNMMGTEELQRLDEIMTVLTSAITNSNEILSDARGAKISEEAAEGIREIDSLGTDRNRSGRGESLNKFLRFQNTTPYYFFKRLGKAGMRMFERIQDGWDKFALNARQVVDFANETYTEQEAKEIQETVYEFQLRRRGDMSEGFEKPETVTMTKAQIMSLYCLWKREQARGHLTGAGIRIADYRQGKNKITQAENYLLDLEDIAKITGKLTERDREIADALQKYMNTVGSDWGNEVSMKRFGIRSFTEENYFPITTDDRTRPVRNPESDTANLYRLLNMSFTKATQRGASNSVVIDNIFDVFANHMADMAKYNGLGLPMLDAMKWVSYNQTSDLNEEGQYGYESVQKSMERAFGKEARNYFTTFMKDLNGVREGGRGEEFGSRMLSSYKVAAVGANIRVALLQPTSYVRAGAVLDKKYLVKGLGMSNREGQEEARKWSGTAVWKDLGFYDTNINAGLREMIKHTDGLKGKIQEVSMKGAELGDKMTWGALWNACKAEQTDKGFAGDELMQKTAERFREVVYRTQVMDSTMTRSHVMRQKGAYAGMVTAFMSEPTLSYNMLLDAYTEYENEVRKEAKGSTDKATLKKAREKAWEKAGPAVGRAATAYLATATLSAIVESLIDAARDDDEYANFLERFAEKLLGFNVKDPDSTAWEKIKGITSGNLMQDLLVHNKLPVVKDFFSILSGNDTSRMDTEWMNNIIRAGQIAWESLALRAGWIDEPTKITYNGNMTAWGKIYNMLRGVSQVTGLPLGNAMRDLTAMWNSTVGEITGKKIQTYDPGPLKQIQYALKDGYITEDDAVKLLMEKELVDDEIEARQKADAWANPERYENLLAAMRAGDREGFEAAKGHLEELKYSQGGITEAVKDDVEKLYLGTDGTEPISREEAIDMLMEYGGMIERKAEAEVQKWTCELETGVPFDKVKDTYAAGDLTRKQAEDMLMEYGGYSEENAKARVQQWTAGVETGIEYSEIHDRFYYGEISQKEAVDMYMKYGGKTQEAAEDTVLAIKFHKDFGYEMDRMNIQSDYADGGYTHDAMKEILLEYHYSKTEKSAESTVTRWDFVGTDWSLDSISGFEAERYYNFDLEGTGIDKHTWLDYLEAAKEKEKAGELSGTPDGKGGWVAFSKIDKRLAFIDSFDLTPAQKDALYLAGWDSDSEGKEAHLERAPWRKDKDKEDEKDSGKSTKKKSSGGRGGGGRGGGRRSGGRRSSGGSGLIVGQAFEPPAEGRSGFFEQILKMWKRKKYSRAQILAFVRMGKLTQEEADEILAQKQDGEAEEPAADTQPAEQPETDGSLKLGAADELEEA